MMTVRSKNANELDRYSQLHPHGYDPTWQEKMAAISTDEQATSHLRQLTKIITSLKQTRVQHFLFSSQQNCFNCLLYAWLFSFPTFNHLYEALKVL